MLMLSGGIDSAAVARELGDLTPHAAGMHFTLGAFPGFAAGLRSRGVGRRRLRALVRPLRHGPPRNTRRRLRRRGERREPAADAPCRCRAPPPHSARGAVAGRAVRLLGDPCRPDPCARPASVHVRCRGLVDPQPAGHRRASVAGRAPHRGWLVRRQRFAWRPRLRALRSRVPTRRSHGGAAQSRCDRASRRLQRRGGGAGHCGAARRRRSRSPAARVRIRTGRAPSSRRPRRHDVALSGQRDLQHPKRPGSDPQPLPAASDVRLHAVRRPRCHRVRARAAQHLPHRARARSDDRQARAAQGVRGGHDGPQIGRRMQQTRSATRCTEPGPRAPRAGDQRRGARAGGAAARPPAGPSSARRGWSG